MNKGIFFEKVAKDLSPLEADIIKVMSENAKYDASDIFQFIRKKNKIARSSVSVLLDRLYKKGLVTRRAEKARGGARYIYGLEENHEKFKKRIIKDTVDSFIKKFGEKAIVYFNESIKERKVKK